MEPVANQHPVAGALTFWEREQLLDYPHEFLPAYQVERSPDSLETLWTELDAAKYDYRAALALFDMLVERYGKEVIARLISNLEQAESMDDWLYRSLGIHTTDIEGEWREWVELALQSDVDGQQ
jgi:hypothetical protein